MNIFSHLSYGVVSASAANIIVLATIVIPVTWFPAHRGKVIGLVTSGYGLSSTLFTPLQTALVNPANIPPVRQAAVSSKREHCIWIEIVLICC